MLNAARMARRAMRLAKVALAAAAVMGVVAFFTWWALALKSFAMVNDCCSPDPTAPRVVTWAIRSVEILSSVAAGVAIAALIQWWLERRPPDCGKRATWAFVFSALALAIAVASDIYLK